MAYKHYHYKSSSLPLYRGDTKSISTGTYNKTGFENFESDTVKLVKELSQGNPRSSLYALKPSEALKKLTNK